MNGHGRLNNLMICYIHADIVRPLNFITIANLFVADVDNRIQVLGKFKSEDFKYTILLLCYLIVH